tara:strand:+ start:2201 stop:2455 length:255 start_codon:yes stop_codon:yes gene_type:complete
MTSTKKAAVAKVVVAAINLTAKVAAVVKKPMVKAAVVAKRPTVKVAVAVKKPTVKVAAADKQCRKLTGYSRERGSVYGGPCWAR